MKIRLKTGDILETEEIAGVIFEGGKTMILFRVGTSHVSYPGDIRDEIVRLLQPLSVADLDAQENRP